MNLYGITKEDKKLINQKIKNQKEFLNTFLFDIGDKQLSLLDSCYSANLNSKKYFAEMNNRVNSIFAYANENDLKPVFVTLTAPAKYHKKDRYGQLKISPNETAKQLSKYWAMFLRLKIFKRMKDDTGHNLIYFRVYEPHKSGVPHVHAMLFLPTDYILSIKKRFFDYFSDFGTNKKAIDFKYNFYNKNKDGNVTGGAIAYIMKYITKTFMNETDPSKVDNAVYWYIKHRIRRFLSSRTLAPLLLYRKVRFNYSHIDNDYLHISQQYKNGVINRFFDDTQFTQLYIDSNSGEIEEKILYSKKIFVDDKSDASIKSFLKYFEQKLIKSFGSEYVNMNYKYLMPNYYVNYIESDLIETYEPMEEIISQIIKDKEFEKEYYIKKDNFSFDVRTHDYTDFYSYIPNKSNKYDGLTIQPSKMKNFQLLQYLKKLDNASIDQIDIKHYGVVKNECIKRDLIPDELVSLNDYGVEFDYVR